jgi:hypothetical protein
VNNTFIEQVIGSLVRSALVALGTWLISHNLTDDASWAKTAEALAPILIAVAWSIRQKYGAVLIKNILASLPSGTTHAEAKDLAGGLTLGQKTKVVLSRTGVHTERELREAARQSW